MYGYYMPNHAALGPALAAEVRAEMARHGHNISDLAATLGVAAYTAKMRHNGTIAFDAAELSTVATWLNVRASTLVARAEAALVGAA